MLAELSVSTTVATLLLISVVTSFLVVIVLGICGGKKTSDVVVPNVIGNPGAPPAAAAPLPGLPGGDLSAPPPLNNFSSKDGIVNDMEAPETLRNTEKFDMASVNFPNFNDFRGDKIADSTNVQNLRAKSRGVSLNAGQGIGVGAASDDSDSSYDSEYDTDSDEEAEAQGASAALAGAMDGPAPPVADRVTIPGRPTIPSLNQADDQQTGLASMQGPPPGLAPISNDPANRVSFQSSLEADLNASIQRNPSSPQPNFEANILEKKNRLLQPTEKSRFDIASLSFNRESVDGYGGNTVTKAGRSVVSTISGVSDVTGINGEKQRKKVRRRKKKRTKKVDENGKSIRVRASRVGLEGVNGNEVERSRKRKKKRRSKNASGALQQDALGEI